MTTDYTTNDAAASLVGLITTRTAVADQFLAEDGKVNWSAINDRWNMLSSGEQAVLILASELGDAPVQHTSLPGICQVLQWCDNEYKLNVANVLTQLLVP